VQAALSEATALIQRMLRGETDPDITMGQTEDIASSGRKPSIVQINATKDEEADDYLHLSAATFAHLRGFFGISVHCDTPIPEVLSSSEEPTAKVRGRH
jgi:hypothetical protein